MLHDTPQSRFSHREEGLRESGSAPIPRPNTSSTCVGEYVDCPLASSSCDRRHRPLRETDDLAWCAMFCFSSFCVSCFFRALRSSGVLLLRSADLFSLRTVTNVTSATAFCD